MPGTPRKNKSTPNSKKGKAIHRQRNGAPAPSAVPRRQTAPAEAAATAAAVSEAPAAKQFKLPDYSYISGELKGIAVLAVILVAVLIVLSFVL